VSAASDPAAAAVGIDVGGTHLRAAIVHRDGAGGPVHRGRSRTDDGATLVADLAAAAEAVDPGGRLPLGLGMAGLVRRDGGFVYGPNVGVVDLPLAALVRDATGRAVTVLNDATAAALGEHRLGAGVGHDDVLLLTLGTGVGGGIVAGGRLLLGAHGFAAELGHLIVEDGGWDPGDPRGVRRGRRGRAGRGRGGGPWRARRTAARRRRRRGRRDVR
jgi:glucokinase